MGGGPHPPELGEDSQRLVVAGEGPGGGVAAATALYARDQNWPSLHRQVLIRPSMRIGPVASSLRYGIRPATASVEGVASATVVTVTTDSTAEGGVRYAARLRRAGIEVVGLRYELGSFHRMPYNLDLSLHRNSKGQS
ncbi:alpha/beta hydrolase [Nonomuraea sp. NPDC059022]|uniref:alpha/beta hydrolase n=1 Tax=Nonomuraea sp. NPDC059022 TaxID=3346705 RepID=UPI00367D90D9